MTENFRIVLRDADGFEGLDSREFDLPLGSSIPIGRASRNSAKQELTPASHNAYIDSPVISRDHAKLSANADTGLPRVYITDSRSMHGTMVNGERLTAHAPKQLLSGDMLQFGIDVNRNEEFFVARKYTFEAHLDKPQPPFSHGFTVPDSEEEEIGTTSRRGSQNNPLTIDESDSESETSNNEHLETTMVGEGFIVDEDEAASVPPREEPYPELAIRETSIEEDISVDEDSVHYSSDEQVDGLEEDLDSAASMMGDSEVDYNSDFEVLDVETEDKSVVADSQSFGEREPERSLPVHTQSDVPNLPPWATRDFNTSFDPMQSASGSELPPMSMARQTFGSNVLNSFPPPLPPRPSASRSSLFNRAELPPTNSQSWFSDEMPSYPNYLGTNHGDRPSLFSPAPVPVPSMASLHEVEPRSADFSTLSAIESNRIQTPPSMPTSDVASTTPPPPSRRTMLSITEIVEEQPPTPTSINSMKRKADVLEEEEMVVVEEPLSTPSDEETVPIVQPAVDAAAQTAAVIAQRPKKQPRSIASRVRNTATYVGYGAMGAAGAVALLSCLPDAFFV